jgi:hypothetical protein
MNLRSNSSNENWMGPVIINDLYLFRNEKEAKKFLKKHIEPKKNER